MGNPRVTETETATEAERPLGRVRGTHDWLPDEYAQLASLERELLDQFARAGYRPMRTPILEFSELHQRKSGAGIVAKLFDVPGLGSGEVCLRPELTASIVRAFSDLEDCPSLPWRVSMSGPVFRRLTPSQDRDREFTQVGVELIGAGGPAADAEVIWLADWTLRNLGIEQPKIRIGHVGLILELFDRSGLPPSASTAVVESLSEAAAEGENLMALESALDRLSGWIEGHRKSEVDNLPAPRDESAGIDWLFNQIVPHLTGRRSSRAITERLRRKCELSGTLHDTLTRLLDEAHALARLRGSAEQVLDRLVGEFEDLAPRSVAALRDLVDLLGHHGVESERIELDLGFGRGIGFYTQVIFEILVTTPRGPVEVCGGGRYDGLARVLGSHRDDRGVGFAFGLERLLTVLHSLSRKVESQNSLGCLVTTGRPGVMTPRAIALGAFLRDRVRIPVVISDLDFDGSVAYARQNHLGSVLVVGSSVELWNLDHGAVRIVQDGELIDEIRGHLAILGKDRP